MLEKNIAQFSQRIMADTFAMIQIKQGLELKTIHQPGKHTATLCKQVISPELKTEIDLVLFLKENYGINLNCFTGAAEGDADYLETTWVYRKST